MERLKGTTHLGLWYSNGMKIETIVYTNSDHANDYVDRKGTNGTCSFAKHLFTPWFTEKQIALATSTTEAESMSAGKTCQQAPLDQAYSYHQRNSN